MDPTTARMMAGAADSGPYIMFDADNYYPVGNTAITLTWNVSNADSVSIDQGIGSVASSGSLSQTANEQKVYTLTAVGLNGLNYTASISIDWSTCVSVLISSNYQKVNGWFQWVYVYETQCS